MRPEEALRDKLVAPEIKLIFIAGTNYSGTTLLSSILGCHPEVESLGQVFEIEDYHRRGRKCMCGEEVPGCPFWSEVLPFRAGRSRSLSTVMRVSTLVRS